MEKLEYIDNVINLIVKDNLINSLEDVINDLRKEECFDEDIYEYINKVVLTILHTKYGDILKQLKDS
jgi:hypothetical protein|tara:strand:+ start:16 stop:216 length:201 start_codon:yes stop_codon:yes gene_type:complete